jgi:hypothetical protein
MIDYFLSGFDGYCLNCLEEERKMICASGMWCDRCLCLSCQYYRKDLNSSKGYCGIRKQLLDELKSEYLENPDCFRRWIKQLKSQDIRVPKVVQEMTKSNQQAKLF